MSFKNEQKCATLKAEGVSLNQSGYASGGGQGSPPPVPVRNRIKNICLKCERTVCVFD